MALVSDRLLYVASRNSTHAVEACAHSQAVPWLQPSRQQELVAGKKQLRWSCQQTGRAMRGFVTARAAAVEAIAAPATKRVSGKFAELKEAGKIAFIPYVVAGDPDLDTTLKALLLLDAHGADILEVGVPYSDPLADGPVIQDASTRALEKGVTLEAVLEMLRKVSPKLRAPVVLFTYYNPIINRGTENFLKSIKEAGASGLLVPDLVLEDTEELRFLTTKHGLELVLLTTPTTPVSRMKAIGDATQGFLYLVSLTGVTGARESVSGRVQYLLKEIKQGSNTPVAVGFGISAPQHATQVVGWGADGVIVGSAIVKLLGSAASPQEGLAAVEAFAKSIRSAV